MDMATDQVPVPTLYTMVNMVAATGAIILEQVKKSSGNPDNGSI